MVSPVIIFDILKNNILIFFSLVTFRLTQETDHVYATFMIQNQTATVRAFARSVAYFYECTVGFHISAGHGKSVVASYSANVSGNALTINLLFFMIL